MSKAKKKRRNPGKAVYGPDGKKFATASSRKAAKVIARVIRGTVGKPKHNPHRKGAMVFRTKAAATKYARTHGLSRFRLKKVARAR